MAIALVKTIKIAGISTRTKTSDEMTGQGKILGLWEQFRTQIYGQKIPAGIPIGAYTNYESDQTGHYTLIAGVEVDENFTAHDPVITYTIPAGTYLKFAAKGAMPDVIVSTWQNIGHYFANPDCAHRRAFTTDFELYPAYGEVEIYIAVISP